jgi:hypothetical protein
MPCEDHMRSAGTLLTLAALTVMTIFAVGAPVAAWSGDAISNTEVVHPNFMERLRVEVHNNGTAPMEVTSITYSIRWSGSTVLYDVFSGSATVEAGGSKEFVSPAVRMPDEMTGDYRYTIAVKAIGGDGQVQERKSAGTIAMQPFSLSFLGMPEAVFVPAALSIFAVLSTLIFFKFERTESWPFLRAEPRMKFHRSRRTKP